MRRPSYCCSLRHRHFSQCAGLCWLFIIQMSPLQVLGAVTTGPQRKGGQQGGPTEVNLWSGKQLGPRGERGSKDGRRQQPSAYRCKPILDSGKTKGSQGNVDTFCIFFAK